MAYATHLHFMNQLSRQGISSIGDASFVDSIEKVYSDSSCVATDISPKSGPRYDKYGLEIHEITSSYNFEFGTYYLWTSKR